MYFTDPVDNPFSRGLTALDENRQPETVDQSKLPGRERASSPRDSDSTGTPSATGDPGARRHRHLHGPCAVRVGRQRHLESRGEPQSVRPFNPAQQIPTRNGAILQQSFDVNAMDPDFKWPQVWTTDLAVDQQLPVGTARERSK